MNLGVDYSIVTPTFNAIAKESFDLFNITPMRLVEGVPTPFATSPSSARCNGMIYVNKIKTDGDYQPAYRYYYNSSKKGWYDESGTTPVPDTDVERLLKKGEAFLVNNKTGNEICFQVSGEVDLINKNVFGSDYTFAGNWTPVTIDLYDITPMRLVEGVPTPFATSPSSARCNGMIYVNKIKTDGDYEKAYRYYYNSSKQGWYDEAGTTKIESSKDTKFAPGEGYILNNKTGNSIVLSITSPIK